MLVNHIMDTIGHTRRNFLELTAGCSPEEMNDIPPGYANNLVWNLAHVVASQQMLCYEQTDRDLRVEQYIMDSYRPGTRPGAFVGADEIGKIRELASMTIDRLKEDYAAGIFTNYKPRQTRFGVLISNIDESISYISVHEGLHFGYAKAMLRLLRS